MGAKVSKQPKLGKTELSDFDIILVDDGERPKVSAEDKHKLANKEWLKQCLVSTRNEVCRHIRRVLLIFALIR